MEILFGQDYINKVLTVGHDNLVRYYPLIENSGSSAVDVSRFAENGTNTNTTYQDWTGHDGRPHTSFNGTSSYVDINTNLDTDLNLGTTGALSYMVWVDHNSASWAASPDATLLELESGDSRQRFHLYSNTTDGYYFSVKIDNGSDWYNTTLTAGELTAPICFICTWDDSTNAIEYYVNGTNVASDSLPKAWDIGSPIAQAKIGREAGTATEYWDGGISHVAIWNTVLTQTIITELTRRP